MNSQQLFGDWSPEGTALQRKPDAARRGEELLNCFSGDRVLDLDGSIEVLRQAGILVLLESVPKAKVRLAEASYPARLKHQAKLVYYFWELIEQDDVHVSELKELVAVLLLKSGPALYQSLLALYPDKARTLPPLIESWRALKAEDATHGVAQAARGAVSRVAALSNSKNRSSASTNALGSHKEKGFYNA